MNEIDWSKAPEWAKTVIRSGGDDGWLYWAEAFGHNSRRQRIKPGVGEDDVGADMTIKGHMWTLVETRPGAWSGEGLPPVGVDIEVLHELYGWIGARVVGQDREAAIVRTNDGYAGVFQHQIRPLRTPEQIAADARDAAAVELYDLISGPGDNMAAAKRVYDAGYRKP